MSSLLRKLERRATRAERIAARRSRGTNMAEQQQVEPGIGLSANYNINTLIGSLMDIQQIVRSMPSIIAGSEARQARIAELEAKVAELVVKLAAVPAAE